MKTWELLSDYRGLKEGDKNMNELVLPVNVKFKIGKSRTKRPIGEITLKTRCKTSMALGLCWLSFRIFFMGVKKLIE